jgi:hypothetical protein
MLLTIKTDALIVHHTAGSCLEAQRRSQSMSVRQKPVTKSVERVEPEDKAKVKEKLRLVAKEVKRLDAHIQDLTKLISRSHFRLL